MAKRSFRRLWLDLLNRPQGTTRRSLNEYVQKVTAENKQLKLVNAGLQASIDMLMLEYCPERMSKEQIANWEKNQKPVSKEEDEAIAEAAKGGVIVESEDKPVSLGFNLPK